MTFTPTHAFTPSDMSVIAGSSAFTFYRSDGSAAGAITLAYDDANKVTTLTFTLSNGTYQSNFIIKSGEAVYGTRIISDSNYMTVGQLAASGNINANGGLTVLNGMYIDGLQVSYGAADSGTSGYRYLKVPNTL